MFSIQFNLNKYSKLFETSLSLSHCLTNFAEFLANTLPSTFSFRSTQNVCTETMCNFNLYATCSPVAPSLPFPNCHSPCSAYYPFYGILHRCTLICQQICCCPKNVQEYTRYVWHACCVCAIYIWHSSVGILLYLYFYEFDCKCCFCGCSCRCELPQG